MDNLLPVQLQQPCNNDGIFVATTSGLNLPITYTYYIGYEIHATHSNVNSLTDQITDLPMRATHSGTFLPVTVVADDGINQVSSGYNTFINPQFIFSTNLTNPVCPNTNGTMEAIYQSGTTGPFGFSWENQQTMNSYSGNNISAPMGEYILQVTDQTTGCVLVLDSINTTQISDVVANPSSTTANCTDGTATANPSGGAAPYTYLWMNGATSQTISNLSTGNASVLVTDVNGCQSYPTGVFIPQSVTITVNNSVTPATCLASDGSAIAFASGGTPPYSYVWTNGQTGNTATNLSQGLYRVIATDANGCVSSSTNASVSASTPITTTVSTTPSSCTVDDGSATLNSSGGTPPYSITWNTYPSTTGNTISNMGSGSYGFTITDAVGCIRTGAANIQPESSIYVDLSPSSVSCPNTTGNITSNVTGSNPPFTYLWSNGATTEDILGVPIGSYTCTVTDALGCTKSKSDYISSQSDMNLGITTTNVSCVFNADGAATVNVTGGTAPYTYSYSNGSTTANATGLGLGYYTLTVTDANGCSKNTSFNIGNDNTNTSCYCTISGTVYADDNENCVIDGGEDGIENVMVHCTGQGYTFTDQNGYYSFQVPTGTYTLTEQTNQNYSFSSCQNSSETVSVTATAGCVSTVNISNQIIPISDLKITTINSGIPPVPGNSYQQKVIIENAGTITETDVQLGYTHDGQLSFQNSSSSLLVVDGGPTNYGIHSGFPSLDPNTSEVILINYNTPTNIPIGTVVIFDDSVANAGPIDVNWLLDETPWNNVNKYNTTTIASYDPNYKEVNPIGIDAPGYISSEVEEFNYTIHFQNEGTYYAQNIYITDQLDDDFDWTTLQPGYSDYSYTTTVSETGLVTFTFANIHLPWKSSFGDVLSSGLVNYSIKRKPNLPQGTEFTNYADIYFDYNAPITTNTTLNTLNDSVFLDLNEEVNAFELIDAKNMDIFPIPAKDMITIRVNNLIKNEHASLNVYDLMGKMIQSEKISLSPGSNIVTQNVSRLSTGTYLTQIQFEDGSFLVKKIVIQ
ncbi:MAG: T9SS type A sorting domain-containing protein [Crocinitomicaceae bacterium]